MLDSAAPHRFLAQVLRPIIVNADHDLKRHRDAIDALDRELLKLLNERAREAQAIGTL